MIFQVDLTTRQFRDHLVFRIGCPDLPPLRIREQTFELAEVAAAVEWGTRAAQCIAYTPGLAGPPLDECQVMIKENLACMAVVAPERRESERRRHRKAKKRAAYLARKAAEVTVGTPENARLGTSWTTTIADRGLWMDADADEPTDHDLVPLVAGLRDAGFRIHLETSGARSVAGMPFEWITVSPKLVGMPLVQRSGHTLKVVVRPDWRPSAWTIVNAWNDKAEFFHRYLQPLTENGRAVNLEEVVAMVQSSENVSGWALSTQAHRAWMLP